MLPTGNISPSEEKPYKVLMAALGSDVEAAAITQFAGGSTKYFGTYHVEFPKPKRDPA